jgi:hypothetical protein
VLRKVALPLFLQVVFLCSSIVAGSSDLQVKVRVRSVDGAPVRTAYVAVIPMWRPSSRPLVELVADKGLATLRVPAGQYRLIAGARGFAIADRAVTVSLITASDVVVELQRLQRVSGTVFDAQGNPIEHARVSLVSGAILPPLDRLSEMAVRELGTDLSTTTDAHGVWTLGVGPGSAPLVIDAPGRAGAWHLYREGEAAALDVALAEGATLRVTTDRIDPDLIVTLMREDAGDAHGVPPEWQAQMQTESSGNKAPAGAQPA